MSYSFDTWLHCICIAHIMSADQTNGLCVRSCVCLCVRQCVFVGVCPCSRVFPGERAPEGESEMLPAASVWSHSRWWSGKHLDGHGGVRRLFQDGSAFIHSDENCSTRRPLSWAIRRGYMNFCGRFLQLFCVVECLPMSAHVVFICLHN